MGLAWIPDDVGHVVADEPGREWAAGPRHRRPTLLARGGQVVADRFTALAGSDPGPAHVGPTQVSAVQHSPSSPTAASHAAGLQVIRRASLPARRYWA